VKEPVEKDDPVVMIPVAAGYVRLATLKWANEVTNRVRA
jgi:hypothetical protein